MSRFVLLDSERLGMASKPAHKSGVGECLDWIARLRRTGTIVVIPEIIRYEIRRDLLRAGALSGLARIDDLATRLVYLPLNRASDQPVQGVKIGGDVRRHLNHDPDGLDPLTVPSSL